MTEKKDKDKYSLQNMMQNEGCPECNSPVILTWTSKGKTFECTKCGKALTFEKYVPIQKKEPLPK